MLSAMLSGQGGGGGGGADTVSLVSSMMDAESPPPPAFGHALAEAGLGRALQASPPEAAL